MKFAEKDVIKAFMEKTGVKINQEFDIENDLYNPYVINGNLEIFDCDGSERRPTALIGKRIETIHRFETREAMHEKLKELANGFKPDWSDEDQSKTSIGYSHLSEMCVAHNTYSYQYSLDTVYFESREAAQKAIDFFTDEEWKMYFGVED